MMMNLRELAILAISLITFTGRSYANQQTYKVDDATIQINVPENWKVAKDLFGNPLTIAAPMQNGTRAVIQITPFDFTNLDFDSDSLDKKQNEFRDERKRYVEKRDGKIIEFKDYKKLDWKNFKEVHEIGLRYTLENTRAIASGKHEMDYVEKGYFILCKNNRFVFVMTHMKTQLEDSFETPVEDLVKGMSCE